MGRSQRVLPYEELHRLYIVENKKTEEIAEILKTSKSTLKREMDRYNMPRRVPTVKWGFK